MNETSQAARARAGRAGLLRVTVLAVALLLAGCASVQPRRAIHIATASTSHTLCAGVFIAGRDADETYREEMRPAAGMKLLDWGLRYHVDRERREVRTRFVGGFEGHAVYRDGRGCLVVHGALPAEPAPAHDTRALPPAQPAAGADIAGPGIVAAQDERIRAAIDEAFTEPDDSSARRAKAVVVVHRGRVIGERYAPGIGLDTAWHGNSVSKSVTHALIGVLVRQGKLSLDQRVSVAQWANAGDARRDVTIDQLLRMSSGLPWDEYAGGFDAATRMWYFERDMVAFATDSTLEAQPGTRWNYSNRGYMVLSRLVRDAVGGSAADVLRFAESELFAPLGMRNVTIEFDATGTPIGSNRYYASARDWARFGLLYLNDGLVGDRRVLPQGWARHAASPTLDTGYGAGFWLNNIDTRSPMKLRWGMPGAPADAYFARGYLGQFVVVVPSRQLVVVRMGVSHGPGSEVESVGRLVGEIVAALEASAP